MYYGEFQHSLDLKNRLILPSKFREQLGSKFIITKGIEKCLSIYSIEEWNEFSQKAIKLGTNDLNIRKFIKILFAGANDCEFDKQGRFIIPQNLKEYAKLEKEITIIGVMNKIEIWNRETWNQYSKDDIDFEKLTEKLSDFIF